MVRWSTFRNQPASYRCTIAAKGLVYGNNEAMRVGLHQRRGADAAGSANNFLMILLGSTPMA